ncbi:hypothetical protein DITRI_Ditri02bG0096400 [Diplodiscus trichospermus]
MGDAENSLPPSKKRAAGREISRDNPGLDDDDDSSEQETGTFKRASDEVLANRRIVKVRRNQTTSTASSNPFSAVRLVPPAAPGEAPESSTTTTEVTAEALIAGEKEVSEDGKIDVNKSEKNEDGNNPQSLKKTDELDHKSSKCESEHIKQSESKKDEPVSDAVTDKEGAEDKGSDVANEETPNEANDEKPAGVKTEDEDKKDDKTANADPKDENADSTTEGASLSSFQQLSSSQNAFTGLAGTGFSTTTFSFGSTPKDGSTSSVPLFGQKTDQTYFGFGLSTNGNSSLFNSSGNSIASKSEGSGFPVMQEVPTETGEENEKVVFSAESVLFEYIDGGWKERGKGELKVNVSTTGTEKARLLMRARGNYRLILNASLYPDMKLTNMEKRGMTFACINSAGEEKEKLSTFALKFKDASIVEEFRAAVMGYKGNTAAVLKAPENSPKALEG